MTNNKKRTRAWRNFPLRLKGSHVKRERGFTYDFEDIERALLSNGKDRCITRELV